VTVEIRRLGPGDAAAVVAAGALFDHPPRPDATARFLAEPGHHLLVAYDGGTPAGFVTGVETTHPDKGTELFLYELSVAPEARRRGIGSALVAALADLARERGCYGMWVLADDDNTAARRTYGRAGGRCDGQPVLFSWDLR
jgi:ribosomal protein S18 acetylase RimI-like enzyme